MTVSGVVHYRAGGYPLPTYDGEVSVSINVANDMDPDEIREKIAIRGRRVAACKVSMTTANISIVKIVMD